MEFPFLSLSKRPRFRPIEYSNPNGVLITVSGGEPIGIASIFDWDLMLWCMSQVRHAADRNLPVSRKIRFSRRAYLQDARRHASGDEYRRLEATIARLKNTMVQTTIRTKTNRTVMFNWIEYAEIERDKNGRCQTATIVLPEWLFEASCDHQRVLTLHRDYFLLTGGIERWLYRIIRKGAGKTNWQWRIRTLHERSGSTQSYKYFARDVRKIVCRGTLLDYRLIAFTRNGESHLRAEKIHKAKSGKSQVSLLCEPGPGVQFLRLPNSVYEHAKKIVPGYDIYAIEQQWRDYNRRVGEAVKFPERAFLGFCRKFAKHNPSLR